MSKVLNLCTKHYDGHTAQGELLQWFPKAHREHAVIWRELVRASDFLSETLLSLKDVVYCQLAEHRCHLARAIVCNQIQINVAVYLKIHRLLFLCCPDLPAFLLFFLLLLLLLLLPLPAGVTTYSVTRETPWPGPEFHITTIIASKLQLTRHFNRCASDPIWFR